LGSVKNLKKQKINNEVLSFIVWLSLLDTFRTFCINNEAKKDFSAIILLQSNPFKYAVLVAKGLLKLKS